MELCVVTDEKGRFRHEFRSTDANELWIGDITEHWTGQCKVYVCAKDVFSNRIVGGLPDRRRDLDREHLPPPPPLPTARAGPVD